ncbi:RNA polymerase sigma factor [Sorangium cellulosum]|uniref:RNA polymerase sigma factor n=1 Tax=Sorangium cellulosum TaxID=56 RepID=UPI001F28102F|nr:RNA polymerase sigma factor [Sorangium cellulosum]
MAHDPSARADGTAAAHARSAPADTAAAGAPGSAAPSPAPAGGANEHDVALLRRLLAGDEQAFAQLVAQLHTPMLRLARTITGPEGAEEVVQETWAAVVDGLALFEGRSSLKTWVLRILTNRARTSAAREKRTVPVAWLEDADPGVEPAVDPARFDGSGDWVAPPAPWSEQSPEGLLLRKELGGVLVRELDGLVPGQRAVIILRDVEGCASGEVCEILGISEVNQRVLLHRGRAKLRTAMERYLTRGE